MRDREAGFTLIELMVTVAVIAILAVVVLPSFVGESRKTKAFAEVQPMFNDLRIRLEQYLQENGQYPPTIARAPCTRRCPARPATAQPAAGDVAGDQGADQRQRRGVLRLHVGDRPGEPGREHRHPGVRGAAPRVRLRDAGDRLVLPARAVRHGRRRRGVQLVLHEQHQPTILKLNEGS